MSERSSAVALGGVYVFGVVREFYGPIVLGLFKTLVELLDEYYVTDG